MNEVYQSPQTAFIDPKAAAESGPTGQAPTGAYRIKIGEIFSEAWRKSAGSKGSLLLAVGIYLIIYAALAMGSSSISKALPQSSLSPSTASFIQFCSSLALLALSTPLWGGLIMTGIKRASDQPVGATEPLKYFHKTLPLLGLMILMQLLILIGLVLLVLPGIYLFISYMMAVPLMLEKNLSPWQALETSRKAITPQWFRFFGFVLVLVLIGLIAALTLMIGAIWAYPCALIAFGILYRNMFGRRLTEG